MDIYDSFITYLLNNRDGDHVILERIADDVLLKMHDDVLTDNSCEMYVDDILSSGFRESELPKITKAISYLVKDKELRDAILDYVVEGEYDEYDSFVEYIQNLHKIVSNKEDIPNTFSIAKDIDEFVDSEEFKELEKLIDDVHSKASIEISYLIYNDSQTDNCINIELGLDRKRVYSTESTMYKTTDGDELGEFQLELSYIDDKVRSRIKSYDGGYISVTISFNEGEKESTVSVESYAPRLFRKGFVKKGETQFKTDGAEELVKILKKRHVKEYIKYCSDPSTWSPSIAEPNDISDYITDLRYLAAIAEIIDEHKDENGKVKFPEDYEKVKDKLIQAGWPIQQ